MARCDFATQSNSEGVLAIVLLFILRFKKQPDQYHEYQTFYRH